MKRSLLLNSNGEPLQFVDCVRAIKLILKGRVEVAFGVTGLPSYWDDYVCSPNSNFRLPAVIRLKHYVHKKIEKKPPRFQKRLLFSRDLWRCQYCGIELAHQNLTVDHVYPSSLGGKTTWRNCVTACKKCNSEKGNKTLEEANMRLSKQPKEPGPIDYWNLCKTTSWHQDWSLFV